MKLKVQSDTTEYEVKINADCWCDLCSEYYTEDEMQPTIADAAVCIYCWEHFN